MITFRFYYYYISLELFYWLYIYTIEFVERQSTPHTATILSEKITWNWTVYLYIDFIRIIKSSNSSCLNTLLITWYKEALIWLFGLGSFLVFTNSNSNCNIILWYWKKIHTLWQTQKRLHVALWLSKKIDLKNKKHRCV